jgi:peptidyl-prolyl cis-trans isomerase SurA
MIRNITLILMLAISFFLSCATGERGLKEERIVGAEPNGKKLQATAKQGDGGKVSSDLIDSPVAVFTYLKTEVIGLIWFKTQVKIFETQLNKPTSVDERKKLLEGIVSDRILAQAAQNEGISVNDSEIETAIRNFKLPYEKDLGRSISNNELEGIVGREEQETGLNWTELLEKIRIKLLIDKYVSQKQKENRFTDIVPDEAAIKGYYNENKSHFLSPGMVKFKHVFVLTKGLPEEKIDKYRKRLSEIRAQLVKGVPYDKFREVFLSEGGEKIGDLEVAIWRRDDEEKKYSYGSELFDALFAMKPKTISEVLESKLGLHLVEIVDIYPFKILTLDEKIPPDNLITVREYIIGMLRQLRSQERSNDLRNEIIDNLKKQSVIRIFDENIRW